MPTYDLSHLTEVVKSGWTGDMFLDMKEALAIGFDSYVTFAGEDLHAQLLTLLEGWDCEETEDGGVLVYRKPDSEEQP